MTQHIDPNKSIKENVLVLINEANASDITLADVDINNIQPVEGALPGEQNTTAYVVPLPEGRYRVDAGGVTVSYRRLSFNEQIAQQVEIKAERSTTIEEIHAQVCEKYGLIGDGVFADVVFPPLGEILPGESFEITIVPKSDGSLIYLPEPKKITITWDGVWINQVLMVTDLAGFSKPVTEKLIRSAEFTPGEVRNYSVNGLPSFVTDKDGNHVMRNDKVQEIAGNPAGIILSGVNAVDLTKKDFRVDARFKSRATTTGWGPGSTVMQLGDVKWGSGVNVQLISGTLSLLTPGFNPGALVSNWPHDKWIELSIIRKGNTYEIITNGESTGIKVDTAIVNGDASYLGGNWRFGFWISMSAKYNGFVGDFDYIRVYELI